MLFSLEAASRCTMLYEVESILKKWKNYFWGTALFFYLWRAVALQMQVVCFRTCVQTASAVPACNGLPLHLINLLAFFNVDSACVMTELKLHFMLWLVFNPVEKSAFTLLWSWLSGGEVSSVRPGSCFREGNLTSLSRSIRISLGLS